MATKMKVGVVNDVKKQLGIPLQPKSEYIKETIGQGYGRGAEAADIILEDVKKTPALRTEEMQTVMDKRRKQMEEGISPEAMRAQKTKVAQQMLEAQKRKGLQLGSALGGMTGASAAAQQRSLAAQGIQAKAGIERDLFLAQEAAKERGLTSFEEIAKYDVSQRAREAEFRATLGLGFEGLQAQREAAILGSQAAREAAAAGGGGGFLGGLGDVAGAIYGSTLGAFNPGGFIEDVGDVGEEILDIGEDIIDVVNPANWF